MTRIHFAPPNERMAHYFTAFYQTRLAVGVSRLLRGTLIEIDAILIVE